LQNHRGIFLAVLLIALGAISCSKKKDEITVGAYLSLSGADSTFGTDTADGIALAVEETNARGGVKNKPIRVLYEDDKSTSQEASQKVRQLIDRDRVVALLGEVSSSRSLAGGLIANTKRVPMLTPTSTNVEVTKNRAYVFRTCFTDAQQGAAAAQYVHDVMKKNRVAIFYAAQEPYASGLSASFRDAFTARGGSIVIEKGYPSKETNFSTYLAEIKALEPELIFAPVYYNDMVIIAQQAHALGIPGSTFVGGDAWDSANLIEGAGEAIEGAHFTDHYAPDVPWPSSHAFYAAFTTKYHREPNSMSAQGYVAARVLFDAIQRSAAPTPEGIKNALAATKNFDSATGPVTIGPDHNANKPVVIVEVKGGQFHYAAQITPDLTITNHHENKPNHDDGASTPNRSFLVALFDTLLNGLAQGAMIALVALGYTMVYGVLKLINFAHSEVFMMGAYAGLFAITGLLGANWNPMLATAAGTILAMLAASGLGVTIERVAYRPLRNRGGKKLSRVTPLVTAIGVSVFLQNLAQLVFSPRYRAYPHLFSHVRVAIFGAAIVVMILLELLVRRTWFGKAMRALSSNEEAARLMGIRTSRVTAGTFAIGSALAALGAVLYCFDQSEVYPTMGVILGTRAFVAAVVGGIGNISGAFIGGIAIGVLGELVKLTDYSGGVDVFVFLALICVLLWKPTGLLGNALPEKV
jgi:branched-subunit amino acid ABC-type transport system permease component/ABC-type branched-subunit amino acid transport system substrate-binding protein